MGNPVETIPNLPPAIALSGAEQFWINQAGVDKRTTLAQALSSIVGVGGSGSIATVPDYATLRAASFPIAINTVVLDDIYKGGMFVRGPATLPDNGGTRIVDAAGQTWWRVYDERINAAWFYSAPPDLNGNPTTLGSGPVQITQADIVANPQWVGLADDGGVGVQITAPYPLGTYWDFVALQEWIYACAGERSVPESTFIGSMQNDGRVRISQWTGTGPHKLQSGQPISGAGIVEGTYVTAPDPTEADVYWVAYDKFCGALNIVTDRGSHFVGWVETTILTSQGYQVSGPPIQLGDEILSPLYPPNTYFNGVFPGTIVGPQISGPPGGGTDLDHPATWHIGIRQTVPSEPMVGAGGATWNTVSGQTWRNVPGYCPRGVMYLNQMLVVNGDGLDLLFASNGGTSLNWFGNATGTSNVGPGLKFNTLAFSSVKGLNITDASLAGVSNYLVSLSHTQTAPGLNVENNTLEDWSVGGNYSTSKCGVAISPEGPTAQGDTQVFIQCWVTGCDDGFTFGGANAIAGTFFGGQTQACPRYGVGSFGGSFSAYTMLTENNAANTYYQTPQRSQIHLGGADFYAAQVATESCVSIGTRSEGTVGMIDLNHQSSVMNWTTGGFFARWQTNFHWTPQTLLAVPNGLVDNNYGVVMIADDGGPAWMESDGATTSTVISFTPNPGWTPNQWADFGIWLLTGRNSIANTIVSNTDHTLTVAGQFPATGANWYKIFSFSGDVAPDWGATTHFGQFIRNASGSGATIAANSNLLSTAQPLVANDWVMIPNAAVFPDGAGVTMALSGQVQNKSLESDGWYIQTFGTTANVWGVPTAPILIGGRPGATIFNFFVDQISGTPGGVGQYELAFDQTLGADFTGSINGAFLLVTAVNHGALGPGQYLGGTGLSPSAPPQILSDGALFNGHVDDGSGGGVTPGVILTVQTVLAGIVRPGTPLTGGGAGANVILNQLTGPAGGAGTYTVNTPQLSARCAFTGQIGNAVISVTAIASGQLQPGQLIQGAGVQPNAFLGDQISGTPGGIGTYNIGAFNVASEAMTATQTLFGGGHAAQFTGHVDDGAGNPGHLLTVTALAGGVLGVGQTVNVPVVGSPGLITLGTILQVPTDTGTGGVGTYTLGGLTDTVTPSGAMTSNTTGGVGSYSLHTALGSPIASQPMLAGLSTGIAPTWEIVDAQGDPVNSTEFLIDAFGYWSAGIADGGLTLMVIDYDVMWGVGALDQCQLGGTGKVGTIGRMDNPYLPGGIQGAAIRPGENIGGQFSYKSTVQFTLPPRLEMIASVTPFAIGADQLNQSTAICTVSANNTVLSLVPLGPGLVVDFDLFLSPALNISGGMILQWDPATVKSPSPTINLGQGQQQTVVRFKWVGNASAGPIGGFWWLMSAEGPIT